MAFLKKLTSKRGSEVIQNVLVLGAMGIIAVLVMLALHGSFQGASLVASDRVANQVEHPVP